MHGPGTTFIRFGNLGIIDEKEKEVVRCTTKIIILIALCVLIGLGVFLLPGFRFVTGMRKLINEQQRLILYHIDHVALAKEMRNYASEKRSQFPNLAHGVVLPTGTDFPTSLKILECNAVTIFPDRVNLEFGGTLLHYGITVFNEGTRGHGTKKLGDGVWFYSEDGRVPAE